MASQEDKELSPLSDKEEMESPVINDTSKTDKTDAASDTEADTNSVQTDNVVNDDDVNPLLPGDESQPAGLIDEDGKINWDCPCLQGMSDGPCGQEFKDAFSCFQYSEGEPKGVDCFEQFKGMQECFLKYPEIYGGLDDDLEEEEHLDESATQDSSSKNVTEEKSSEGNGNDIDKVENVTEQLGNTSLPNS